MSTTQYSSVDKEIKAELLEYVQEKYGREFEEVFYETAVDATQNYTLCLRDGQGRIFNVYENGGTGKRTDDYKNSIVDHKMKEYITGLLGEDLEGASVGVMAVMNVDGDIAALDSMSAEDCIERFGLYSLVFAYHFDGTAGSIVHRGEVLMRIFNKLSALETDTIDFNVVVTSGDASEVKEILENMRHRYSGSWYRCANVVEYISRANPGLKSIDDLKALVKE